jgi:hypothetical protein
MVFLSNGERRVYIVFCGGFYLILQQDVIPSRHSQDIKNRAVSALKIQPFVVKNRYVSKYITKNHLGVQDFAALEYPPLPPYSFSIRYGRHESTPSPGS